MGSECSILAQGLRGIVRFLASATVGRKSCGRWCFLVKEGLIWLVVAGRSPRDFSMVVWKGRHSIQVDCNIVFDTLVFYRVHFDGGVDAQR